MNWINKFSTHLERIFYYILASYQLLHASNPSNNTFKILKEKKKHTHTNPVYISCIHYPCPVGLLLGFHWENWSFDVWCGLRSQRTRSDSRPAVRGTSATVEYAVCVPSPKSHLKRNPSCVALLLHIVYTMQLDQRGTEQHYANNQITGVYVLTSHALNASWVFAYCVWMLGY